MSSDDANAAPFTKTYSSFGAAIDLVSQGASLFGVTMGKRCRQIRCKGAGTVTLRYGKNDAGTDITDTISTSDGEKHQVQADRIMSVSGVTEITVYW